jgi:hypothetical protein
LLSVHRSNISKFSLFIDSRFSLESHSFVAMIAVGALVGCSMSLLLSIIIISQGIE